MTDYKPIACATHSYYELWSMRRQRLQVYWRDAEGRDRRELLFPQDLETSEGEEFLCAETAEGHLRRIRLDRIQDAHPLPRDEV